MYKIGEVKLLEVDDVDCIEEQGGNGCRAPIQIGTGTDRGAQPARLPGRLPEGYAERRPDNRAVGHFSTLSNTVSGTRSAGMSLVYWVPELEATQAAACRPTTLKTSGSETLEVPKAGNGASPRLLARMGLNAVTERCQCHT